MASRRTLSADQRTEIEQQNRDIAHAMAQLLTPDELALVVNWVYHKTLKAALSHSNLSAADYAAWPEDRKELVASAVKVAQENILISAQSMMQQLVMAAVTELGYLLKDDDAKVRFRAAKLIVETNFGRPPIGERPSQGVSNLKSYAVHEVSPDVWDADTEREMLTSGGEDDEDYSI